MADRDLEALICGCEDSFIQTLPAKDPDDQKVAEYPGDAHNSNVDADDIVPVVWDWWELAPVGVDLQLSPKDAAGCGRGAVEVPRHIVGPGCGRHAEI